MPLQAAYKVGAKHPSTYLTLPASLCLSPVSSRLRYYTEELPSAGLLVKGFRPLAFLRRASDCLLAFLQRASDYRLAFLRRASVRWPSYKGLLIVVYEPSYEGLPIVHWPSYEGLPIVICKPSYEGLPSAGLLTKGFRLSTPTYRPTGRAVPPARPPSPLRKGSGTRP